MKSELSSLDLHYLLKELDLERAKINQIYQINKEEIILELHVPSKGKAILRIMLGKMIYIASQKPITPQTPPGFCVFLRRYIKSGRISSIEQLEFDRVIKIVIETKTCKFHMYIETFDTGNIILCDDQDIIKSPLNTQRRKERMIARGKPYIYPKKPVNFLDMSKEEFKRIIQESDKENLVKTLAIKLGLGGRYSEEICHKAGIDKNSKTVDDKGIDSLFKVAQEIKDQPLAPAVITDTDIVPFKLDLYKDLESTPCPSFSAAIDSIFTIEKDDVHIEETKATQNTKLDSIQDIITTQQTRAEGLETSAAENQRKGELIYEHYTEIAEILEKTKNGDNSHPLIKKVDKKKGEIVIEVD